MQVTELDMCEGVETDARIVSCFLKASFNASGVVGPKTDLRGAGTPRSIVPSRSPSVHGTWTKPCISTVSEVRAFMKLP